MAEPKVAAAAAAAASVTKAQEGAMAILVHPLVVMNIADHYSRTAMQLDSKAKDLRVVGALWGTQKGREVHVRDSMELLVKETPDGIKVVESELKADFDLFKECFKTYECLGWYSTGSGIRKGDKQIHYLMNQFNERPLYLVLDPNDKRKDEVPLLAFQETVHIIEGKAHTKFTQTKFKLHADEAERISVVHAAEVTVQGSKGSSLPPYLLSLRKAIQSLNERVRMLHRFLSDVNSNKIQTNQQTLRALRSVCNRLPTLNSSKFQGDFLSEYNEALLVTYLASLTKGASMASALVNKFNTVFSKRGRMYQGGHRGGPGAW